MPVKRPDVHGGILRALAKNQKLPEGDRPRVEQAIERYAMWRQSMEAVEGEPETVLRSLVQLTNEYKKYIEFDLVFMSPHDFLYRQAGQLKLYNTVLEEFLPFLVDERLVPGLQHITSLTAGPQSSYAGMFIGPVNAPLGDGGLYIKTKNQDFTVGRRLHIRACPRGDFNDCLDTSFNVAHFVSEVKTNLDKTMFQEAAATARELKSNVGDAVYVLLCEWLDMPPIDTRVTEIDEVIILRRAKRLSAGIRAKFSTAKGRENAREIYERHLDNHPLSEAAFARIIEKLKLSFPENLLLNEAEVLERGYF